MDVRTIHGYEPFRLVRRLIAYLLIVCSVHTFTAVLQSAHAAVFKPTTTTELVAAFATAGENAQDDVIHLDGYTFELTDQLILKPDGGHTLELRDGTLERLDTAPAFRLLNLQAIPSSVEHDGLPVIIKGVEFRNGLFRNNDQSVDNQAGGGALLTMRKTLINNARFTNNRVLGNGSGGAIKHTKLLEISKALFVNNHASALNDVQLAQGGAIASAAGARLFVGHGYFMGNFAGRGGAIFASDEVIDLNITRSAFNNNRAHTYGGAIWSNVGKGGVRVSNSSFIENQAPMGGGAFYTQAEAADIMLFHITMWGNESDPGLGAGIRAMAPLDSGRFSLRNSIIANNFGGNCSGIESVSLSIDYSSHNVLDDESCGQHGIDMLTETDSLISGAFDYHGGSIPSLPIEITSLASNLVPRANCLSFDSRDVPRLDNGFIPDQYCDAGAFEFVPQEYIDMDGDAVGNQIDNCVRVSNPLQSDIDGDGRGDECDYRDDRDSDQDIVLNFHDNCPGVSNFLQLDRNTNGIGDACESAPVRLTLAPVIR